MPNSEAYTCRMHPEVWSDQPGNCPKCGMILVPKGSVDHQSKETENTVIPGATVIIPKVSD